MDCLADSPLHVTYCRRENVHIFVDSEAGFINTEKDFFLNSVHEGKAHNLYPITVPFKRAQSKHVNLKISLI